MGLLGPAIPQSRQQKCFFQTVFNLQILINILKIFLKGIDLTWSSGVAKLRSTLNHLECKISAVVAVCGFYLSPAIALTPGVDSLSFYVDLSASIIITGCVFPGLLIESIPFVLVKKKPTQLLRR